MSDEDTTKKIAARIKEIRRAKGLKQTDMADRAGLSANYFARVERGEVVPSIETIKKIAQGLGVKSSDLLPF